MSEPPFEVRYSPDADAVIGALPRPARRALQAALRELASDPMTAGTAYDSRWPPQFRLIPFGGTGMLACIVLPKQRQVVIEHVVWVG